MFIKIFPIVILIVVLCASVTFPARRGFAAPAAITFTVNSTLDQIDDDTSDGICHTTANTCTLRAAIMQANIFTSPGVTINLPAGIYTLTRPPLGLDGDDSGDLNFTTPATDNPISLLGAGAGSTIIDGNMLDRVFNVAMGRTATISGVTIRNGNILIEGGGIKNEGTLNVNNTTISGNRTGSYGGGIESGGVLNVSNSTISGNNAVSYGGGIYTGGGTIRNSTIRNNIAGDVGGGIDNLGISTLINSTISENIVTNVGGGGGGIYNEQPLDMSGSTVYGNSAPDGGGIYTYST